MIEMEIALKKKQPTKVCGSILIGEFLDQNGETINQVVEEKDHQDAKFQKEIEDEGHEEENLNEGKDHEIIAEKATSKKKTRGSTQCLKIHARNIEERPKVILDEHGELVGSNDKVVSDLSYFLRTIARNSDFCPLIYTNFKALFKDYKDHIWKYSMVFESLFCVII